MHIMGYVLQSSDKAWKNNEDQRAPQNSKVTSKSKSDLESLLANNNNSLSIIHNSINNKLNTEKVGVLSKFQISKDIAKWTLGKSLLK